MCLMGNSNSVYCCDSSIRYIAAVIPWVIHDVDKTYFIKYKFVWMFFMWVYHFSGECQSGQVQVHVQVTPEPEENQPENQVHKHYMIEGIT